MGAKVNNLKNIDLVIPQKKLTVITGLSGSGKSSLAFDTIYAEGQRRYMETMSRYSRQFVGNLERPDVDSISGLSPVIAIQQKTTNKNPRSTVGTITEIYDMLRLLYARISEAISPATGNKMVKYSESQILELINKNYKNKQILVLAPLVKGRKGHYRELFDSIKKQGFIKVLIDGEIVNVASGMQVDRYKTHDISLIIDKLTVNDTNETRLKEAVKSAFIYGKDTLSITDLTDDENVTYSKNLICPVSGISFEDPEPNLFSFNSPYGSCPKCNGLGTINEVDIDRIFPDKSLSIKKGGIAPLGEYKANNWIFSQIELIGKKFGFDINTPVNSIPDEAIHTILYGANEKFYVKNSYIGVTSEYYINFDGLVNYIEEQDKNNDYASLKKWSQSFMNAVECPECHGARLNSKSLQFKIEGKNIAELSQLELTNLKSWLSCVYELLDEKRRTIAHDIFSEINKRIDFIINVGLGYLSLNRPSQTLSGGESQRIRLATQIGSQLIGVLYILDEPSIGLHQRDNHRIIESLKQLRDIGNTVIVVEHDIDTMKAADHIIDIGPGAGRLGGYVSAQGDIKDIEKSNSITGKYLSGEMSIPTPQSRRQGNGKSIVIHGASGNNLKNVTVEFPLNKIICVTGVSGSGKSSLINYTLYPILSNKLYRSNKQPLPYSSITGLEYIDKVIEIDQSPIGRTSRSNPATYTNVYTDIRKLFAELPQSKIRGYKLGRFSFNTKGGRCEECQGTGEKTIEMNFMPNVYVKCEKCQGKRFTRDTLEVRYRGKSIYDVLNLTINQAVEFFANIPSIQRKIKVMQDVGLGYLRLGQSSTTLSGGEAQRIKLATELSKKDTGKTLYILDEPTTGLHIDDVKVLLNVLNSLADKGNTIIIIEHNIDVIRCSDYIIDIGPEGGEKGGNIVATGTPEDIKKKNIGFTAQYL